MKMFASVVLLCGLVISAQAVDPMFYSSDQATDIDQFSREMDYCQLADAAWNAINASTGYLAELVDDLPDTFECNVVTSWDFYVVQWGSQWQDPTGVILKFYNSACPPDLGPDQEATYVWMGEYMTGEMVYDAEVTAWRIHIEPNDQTHVENPMSVGISIENDWGEAAPYVGIALTAVDDISGACEAQFDGESWGLPRWTTISDALGYSVDMAYCMTMETTPTEESSWSTVKELY